MEPGEEGDGGGENGGRRNGRTRRHARWKRRWWWISPERRTARGSASLGFQVRLVKMVNEATANIPEWDSLNRSQGNANKP